MSLRREDNVHYTAEHRAEEAEAEIERAHRHWRNVLKAVVDMAIKDRVPYSKDSVECVMEQVGENLAHEVDAPLSELHELWNCGHETISYTPKGSGERIVEEYERLVGAFHPKPIDASKVLRDALRPVPTNPATKGFDHE